ncbi:MAG: transcription elongation factor GreA [Deltaproteobacteria bacterium]|nr:transcription elongation factor GreA [Deltaproteobacteria bacterium]
MVQRVPITAEGFRKLREQLRHIKEVERPQNVRDIEVARSHGDLSENAEYHAAKERQGFLDAQMKILEDKVGRAEVIDPSTLSGERVVFGATVHLEDMDNDATVIYQIVGDDEADPAQGRISLSSPVSRALIGKSVGEEVRVRTPGGVRIYEIIDVEFK